MTTPYAPLTSSLSGLNLDELVQVLLPFEAKLLGSGNVRVQDVEQDSRRVKFGDLFVARPGGHTDGQSFIDAAVHRGASAVMTSLDTAHLTQLPVPIITVTDPRRALAFAAEAVQGFPSRQLPVVGITGTNGKTTTVALVQRGLTAAGAKPARLGTTGFSFGAIDDESNLTTPEADEISRLIGKVARGGGSHFIMEVSSHALDQGRVDALRFATAAFTNLTQDHLDHHGSMELYELAKQRLFVDMAPSSAVINVDNPTGVLFADTARTERLWRVGRKSECNVSPLDVTLDAQGIRGTIRANGLDISFQTSLIGEHNLENLLVAVGILQALDVDVCAAVAGFSGSFGVPGRLERCETSEDDIIVLVDYAHTPDALQRVLQAVKRFAKTSVHCVFGCGGDRDPNKRPKMGYAVGTWADFAIVTNDNPRTEQPEAIAAAIEPGLREAGAHYSVVLDRAAAIEQTILEARAGDVVLIAGKGHEPYQIIGTTKRPFDDRDQARRALAIRRGRARSAESWVV
jgi:UDP-N-acetylmuramoyl-L-alanyl-D-glutamate--2,6-diaminopimelate ligase